MHTHPWQRTPNAGWRQVSKPGRQQQCYMWRSTGIGLQLKLKPPNHEIHAAQLASVAQAIAPGNVAVLPLHAEEMYNPEMPGQDVPTTLQVQKGHEEARQ